jgi:hypothetical protein
MIPAMRTARIAFALLCSIPGSLCAQQAAAAVDPIDAAIALARPREQEERWRLVPWHDSLVGALEVARERRRPVFYFGYDGTLDDGFC